MPGAENPHFNEWTFGQDDSGVVYCLGRNIDGPMHEAVAVYALNQSGNGPKASLDDNTSFDRIMYHGFPEEDERLHLLRPDIRESILGKMSLREHCVCVNPTGLKLRDETYRNIETWLGTEEPRMQPFRTALERTCDIADKVGLSLEGAFLYGGASFGLVGAPEKVVDDVDLLLDVTARELLDAAQEFSEPYEWSDIDPQSILSERRVLLKAKRWSTSQIRIADAEPLTIDLKGQRNLGLPSLWESLPRDTTTDPYHADLKVIDDSETFCISPAVLCEDRNGEERIVLFRGYPYIGCAIEGDIITVRGQSVRDSSCVLVTQAENDMLIPDFSNVPIS